MNKTDELCVNTLRFLAVDAVEKAKSGHPGLPLGAAPIAYVVWDRFLRHSPGNPSWFNRDRFILSAGHGSALLYALLHMTGYDLPLEELKEFRQWGSKTPGHPESGLTPGIEVTTGPLGQGFAMGVGMAMAERYLSQHFNRPGLDIIDHFVYALVSDGDLMEGVSHETASIAGTLGLGRLIYLYDYNDISIEGHTDIAFTENVGQRFGAYGWHVEHVADANDLDAIEKALGKARAETGRPSLIIVRSHIGFGSPKQDDASSHGEPLGPEATRATKQNLGWPLEPAFYVPDKALSHFRQAVDRGKRLEAEWGKLSKEFKGKHPDLAAELERVADGGLPDGWDASIPVFAPDEKPIATRAASGRILNALAGSLFNLIGGSADLAPSNKTLLDGYSDFGAGGGRNIRFGVREFGMAGMVNGMAMHGGMIPYGGTFLVFSDYARPAIRLAALMGAHSIFVFTHDSIALGEDGPTHQPVEHLMSLRAIPGLTVLRPADANETAECWKLAIKRKGPAVLALTRQSLPVMDTEISRIEEGVSRGAYVIREAGAKSAAASVDAGARVDSAALGDIAATADAGATPALILLATGSEVSLALDAAGDLEAKGIPTRVVSMPSWEIFDEQPGEYRRKVLPAGVPMLAIEAGITTGWEKYTHDPEAVLGLNRFGASAPGPVAYRELGFSVDNVVKMATNLVRV
ncbi:MAG: transketolase [bacterium]